MFSRQFLSTGLLLRLLYFYNVNACRNSDKDALTALHHQIYNLRERPNGVNEARDFIFVNEDFTFVAPPLEEYEEEGDNAYSAFPLFRNRVKFENAYGNSGASQEDATDQAILMLIARLQTQQSLLFKPVASGEYLEPYVECIVE
ncbi:unnamed protein product [Didymodactylos carnosus]|uniref:Secreted protein n=1 Tax=Didymodactylos carnosus TaxID=1234261 RepID=A0A815TY17_9BILA|nr:unnamed protein product [Didymodactylos carnosus]CAF1513109.1 unnamed protein product [Didymodactylos carnosus]CAF3803933.1 unnamed protein product [Didymodactylos carnosus]CAF4373448.1 unnamed protein product [Didymodactylos carnosus]